MVAFPDDQIIRDAAVLTGLVGAQDELSCSDMAACRVLLGEMRAETETIRLARRLAGHWNVPLPATD